MVHIVVLFTLLISSCGVIEIRDKGKSINERSSASLLNSPPKNVTVRLKKEENLLNVNIEMDKTVSYKVFKLKNPDRVVVDIYDNINVKIHSTDRDVKYRIGPHPWGTRLVLDVNYTNVKETRTYSSLSLSIYLTSTETSPKQDSPPHKDFQEVKSVNPRVKLPVKGVIERTERGVFIKTSCNEFFRAVEDGTVIYSGNSLRQYNWVVMVNQKDGFISVYAKAESSFVKKGETVKKSQVLGKVGRSGETCGILYELRTEDGSPIKFDVTPD